MRRCAASLLYLLRTLATWLDRPPNRAWADSGGTRARRASRRGRAVALCGFAATLSLLSLLWRLCRGSTCFAWANPGGLPLPGPPPGPPPACGSEALDVASGSASTCLSYLRRRRHRPKPKQCRNRRLRRRRPRQKACQTKASRPQHVMQSLPCLLLVKVELAKAFFPSKPYEDPHVYIFELV